MPTLEDKAREANRQEKCPRPTFENLLDQVGSFGLYQRLMCVALIGGSTFVCSLTYYAQLLMMLTPPLTCEAGPAAGQTDDGCTLRPDSNGQRMTELATVLGERPGNWSAEDVAGVGDERQCHSWSYDTDVLFDTVASEVRISEPECQLKTCTRIV